MDFKTGIKQMVDNISRYEKGGIDIDILKENLFALYEFIDGRLYNDFADTFHKYWDYIEEVCATNMIVKYREIIDGKILPELKSFLLKQLWN